MVIIFNHAESNGNTSTKAEQSQEALPERQTESAFCGKLCFGPPKFLGVINLLNEVLCLELSSSPNKLVFAQIL